MEHFSPISTTFLQNCNVALRKMRAFSEKCRIFQSTGQALHLDLRADRLTMNRCQSGSHQLTFPASTPTGAREFTHSPRIDQL